MALCKVALLDGPDLVAKEMEFGQGWNSDLVSLPPKFRVKF